MISPQMKWKPRYTPLAPQGLLVRAGQKGPLFKRLLSMTDSQLSTMKGSCNIEIAVIIAKSEDLPWIPEGIYLGKDPLAQHLWLPTNLLPETPLDLIDGAVCLAHGKGQYVINPWEKQIYDVTNLLSLSRAHIEAIEQ